VHIFELQVPELQLFEKYHLNRDPLNTLTIVLTGSPYIPNTLKLPESLFCFIGAGKLYSWTVETGAGARACE